MRMPALKQKASLLSQWGQAEWPRPIAVGPFVSMTSRASFIK